MSQIPEPSMLDVLMCDHRDTMALLKHFAEESKRAGSDQMLEMLTDAISLSIRLHSEGEFQVLYPWVEIKMKDKSTVSHFLNVHHGIEDKLMVCLEERKSGSDSKLTSTMNQVLSEFSKHLQEVQVQNSYVITLYVGLLRPRKFLGLYDVLLLCCRCYCGSYRWLLPTFDVSLLQEEDGLVDVFEKADNQELQDLAENFIKAKESAPLMPQTSA